MEDELDDLKIAVKRKQKKAKRRKKSKKDQKDKKDNSEGNPPPVVDPLKSVRQKRAEERIRCRAEGLAPPIFLSPKSVNTNNHHEIKLLFDTHLSNHSKKVEAGLVSRRAYHPRKGSVRRKVKSKNKNKKKKVPQSNKNNDEDDDSDASLSSQLESEEDLVELEDILDTVGSIMKKPNKSSSFLKIGKHLCRLFNTGWDKGVITKLRPGKVRSNCEVAFQGDDGGTRDTLLMLDQYRFKKNFSEYDIDECEVGDWFFYNIHN